MTRRREAILIAVLAVAAASWGTWCASASMRQGTRVTLYDFAYGPAVMLACGRGYVNPDSRHARALDDFLHTRTDRLSCADVPSTIAPLPLMGYQRCGRLRRSGASSVSRGHRLPTCLVP